MRVSKLRTFFYTSSQIEVRSSHIFTSQSHQDHCWHGVANTLNIMSNPSNASTLHVFFEKLPFPSKKISCDIKQSIMVDVCTVTMLDVSMLLMGRKEALLERSIWRGIFACNMLLVDERSLGFEEEATETFRSVVLGSQPFEMFFGCC